MSETNHPWCRDVSRDEAIRAAEDAAAAERTPPPDHRDLPSVVAELRERVARLTTKHNALVDLARLDAGWVKTQEDCLAAERDAALRERDAALARVAELESAANTATAANAGGEQSQPPRGWLTKDDGEALYLACAVLHGVFVGSWREKHDAAKRLEAIRVRAIREAGGEVE